MYVTVWSVTADPGKVGGKIGHPKIQWLTIIFLVGGLEHEFYFSIIYGNFIIPSDDLIFFRGAAQPPISHHFSPTKLQNFGSSCLEKPIQGPWETLSQVDITRSRCSGCAFSVVWNDFWWWTWTDSLRIPKVNVAWKKKSWSQITKTRAQTPKGPRPRPSRARSLLKMARKGHLGMRKSM